MKWCSLLILNYARPDWKDDSTYFEIVIPIGPHLRNEAIVLCKVYIDFQDQVTELVQWQISAREIL